MIKDYIGKYLRRGKTEEVAEILGISRAMVYAYREKDFNPSLKVAKMLYSKEKIVLHPFAEESLKKELENDK